MRRILRSMAETRESRLAILGDAAGVVALFAMAYAALHLPLVS